MLGLLSLQEMIQLQRKTTVLIDKNAKLIDDLKKLRTDGKRLDTENKALRAKLSQLSRKGV